MTKHDIPPDENQAEKRAGLIAELISKSTGRDSINTMLKMENLEPLSTKEYESLKQTREGGSDENELREAILKMDKEFREGEKKVDVAEE